MPFPDSTEKPLNLRSEACLAATLRFDQPLSPRSAAPSRILLTGATGFVGAYLLDELLRQTGADIYCLIRGRDENEGKQRLREHLRFYSLWQEDFEKRLNALTGDLAAPRLGLPEHRFNELAATVDVIFHNGALVNALYPYSKFKGPNVDGTLEILRLAGMVRTKPLHFISTLAVFFSREHLRETRIRETDIPSEGISGGYGQSKWAAEQMVAQAMERGLPACIYRLARIVGHSETGIMGNLKDLFCLFLKACIRLERCPDLDGSVNLVPVDYTARAICRIAQQPSSRGQAFHIANPCPAPWRGIFQDLQALGYPLRETTRDIFLQELRQYSRRFPAEKDFGPLWLMLRSPGGLFAPKPLFDAGHTRKALDGSGIACPPIDREILSIYMNYFEKNGYFAP